MKTMPKPCRKRQHLVFLSWVGFTIVEEFFHYVDKSVAIGDSAQSPALLLSPEVGGGTMSVA